MSWQAREAVLSGSKFVDAKSAQAPLLILLALAGRANKNGRVGVEGESKKCPSLRRIAEDARTTKKTVSTWLPELCESNELSVVASGGKGRGSWTVYQLHHLEWVDIDGKENLMGYQNELMGYEQVGKEPIVSAPIDERMGYLEKQMGYLAEQMGYLAEQMGYLNGVIGVDGSHTGALNQREPNNNQNETTGGNQQPAPPSPRQISKSSDSDNLTNQEWSQAVDLVAIWKKITSSYTKLSPDNSEHKADYFAPALLLVTTFKDFEKVKTAVSSGYDEMLQAGYTPRKLAPVARQIMAAERRKTLPAPADSKNGAVSKQTARRLVNEAVIDGLFGV